MSFPLSRRERLQAAIGGEAVDRVPVALWRHFPGDDQSPADLASAVLGFQRQFDFDFVKLTPASSYCLRDWGAADVWQGNTEGTGEYTGRPIQAPGDWETLPILDPRAGSLGENFECLRLIGQALRDETPFIPTIFNPLSQARNLAGNSSLLDHMRGTPGALHAGLETITLTAIRFIEEARSTGISGIFLAVQHASRLVLSEAEYREFGEPYDRRILQAASDLWLNVLHLHGEAVMFDLLSQYPAAVINWHDREGGPSLAEGMARFKGAVCGGWRREETLMRGTPEQVRREAEDAIAQTKGRRLILGAGCVTPIVTPLRNLRAARESAAPL